MAIPPGPGFIHGVLSGTPVFLGQVVATTTKNNADTAVPFNATGDALEGKVLLIQADAAGYLGFGSSSSATVTTANGVKLAADERVVVVVQDGYGFLCGLAVSGTANFRVWELV